MQGQVGKYKYGCDSLVCRVDILKEVAIHSGCHDTTADHAGEMMYAQRDCRETYMMTTRC
jgi:hypothetical protein